MRGRGGKVEISGVFGAVLLEMLKWRGFLRFFALVPRFEGTGKSASREREGAICFVDRCARFLDGVF